LKNALFLQPLYFESNFEKYREIGQRRVHRAQAHLIFRLGTACARAGAGLYFFSPVQSVRHRLSLADSVRF
jgi:hypothetical protein